MIGLIIAAHLNLAEELIKAAEFILGKLEAVRTLSIDPSMDVTKVCHDFKRAISDVDQGKGVLIMTDMFGGTPTNISLSFLKEKHIEVISGVNLPMIIKFIDQRDKYPLTEVALQVKEAGVKAIHIAGSILEKK